MSLRIKRYVKLISFSLLNVIMVLTFYNFGIFLGEILQNVKKMSKKCCTLNVLSVIISCRKKRREG